MGLPYYLGCPGWGDAGWRGSLFPDDLPGTRFLGGYARVFNTVEGNTTFYAWPQADTVRRWAAEMPAGFRFCAKVPRDISHAPDLRPMLEALDAFEALLAPLGERVTPLWLQLPASFGPLRIAELVSVFQRVSRPLALEVRHPAFFARGDEERGLNRLLRDHGVERICLDTRALFNSRSSDAAVIEAQTRKPRLPVRPTAFSAQPQLRFVGHPQLEENDSFLQPWLAKVAEWLEAGLTPHVYLHMADNRFAPLLARRFHELLAERLPGLPALTGWPEARAAQLDFLAD